MKLGWVGPPLHVAGQTPPGISSVPAELQRFASGTRLAMWVCMARNQLTFIRESLFALGLASLLAGCSIRTTTSEPASAPRAQGGLSMRGSVQARATGAAFETRGADAEDGSGNSISLGSSIECHGVNEMTVQDRVIETGGNGVEAHGACKLTLLRCTIRAGGVGLAAHGSSQIVLKDSKVEGGTAALMLHGASRVETQNTQFKGRIEKHGMAALDDRGGNAWN